MHQSRFWPHSNPCIQTRTWRNTKSPTRICIPEAGSCPLGVPPPPSKEARSGPDPCAAATDPHRPLMLLLIMHDRECAQAHEHEVPDDDHLSTYPAPLRFPDPEGAHHVPRGDLGQQVVVPRRAPGSSSSARGSDGRRIRNLTRAARRRA
jgi:hypothetical protein